MNIQMDYPYVFDVVFKIVFTLALFFVTLLCSEMSHMPLLS